MVGRKLMPTHSPVHQKDRIEVRGADQPPAAMWELQWQEYCRAETREVSLPAHTNYRLIYEELSSTNFTTKQT